MPRILFVSGFHPSTRARDLAYEFERYVLLSLETPHKPNPFPQLWPLNPLRCSCSPQPIRTFQSVGPFLPSFLPALSPQCHECLRRTFARRLARTHTRMHAYFHFDFERRRLPRHSISRRVRTKAQRPSTIVVTHSSSFAALATLRMPITTCMSQPYVPFFQHLIFNVFFLSQAWTHVRGFASRHTGEFLISGFIIDGSFSQTFWSVGQEPSIVRVANQ